LSVHTVDSFWDGETVDLHMAVDGVLDCEDDPLDPVKRREEERHPTRRRNR
jgi:hypothetical protein